jgi:hypothetical protein
MTQQMSNPINAFEEYVHLVQSQEELDYYLRNSLSIDEPYIECRECIVYHKGDLGAYFNSIDPEYAFTINCINKNIPAFIISRKNEKEEKPNQGIIVILKSTNDFLYRIVTVSRSEFWNNVVKPFLRKKYPAISIVYFRQDELEQALLNFEIKMIHQFSNKARISVVEVTRKSERASKLSQRIKYINTERSWTNSSLSETFVELKERGFWFTSLKFQISIAKSPNGRYYRRATGRISKFGAFSCTNMYNEVRLYLIEPLEHIAAERMHLLEGRGIVERDYKPGPPLEIVYDEEVFNTTEKVRQFGETLSHYHDASIVTYHGNPYYHANIADQRDGSSFEIWVLSQHRILISPQAKSSAHALSRVISYIFDRFKEGDISEYVPGKE